MPLYDIEGMHGSLGTYAAPDADMAREALAHDTGYDSYAALLAAVPDSTPLDIVVTPVAAVTLDAASAVLGLSRRSAWLHVQRGELLLDADSVERLLLDM